MVKQVLLRSLLTSGSSSQGGERNALCVLLAGAAVVASFRINLGSFAFLVHSSGAAKGAFCR